jgi:large subunit ribosomal protein L21
MYAIIKSGSKQYRVQKDDVVCVELITGQPGQTIEFRDVLFVGDESGAVKVGMPTVSGCVVTAQYLGEAKGKKIESMKYKRRKNCYRKFGHRQHFSQVKIIDIVK